MKISIITVCLNAEDTIENTFLSVINQTYKNIELIVIDGASKDRTIEIISKYTQKISHFISEPDKGIYDAMNKGILLATGDFIIFMNANDEFFDNFVLEKVVKTLTENPEVKFLFGDVQCTSKDNEICKLRTFEHIKNNYSLMLDNLCHQSIFYHRSLFEKFGIFSLEYPICADWEFNIRCLVKEKSPALYLNLPLAKVNLDGISSQYSSVKDIKNERQAILSKYYGSMAFSFSRLNNFIKNHFGFIHKAINICSSKIFFENYLNSKCLLNIIKN